MVVVKNRYENKVKKDIDKNGQKKNDKNRKETKYVWAPFSEAIFLVTADARESKFSFSVPIIPLHGLYYSSKDKHKYTAQELKDYFVVLNVRKDDQLVYYLKKGVVVIIGYSEDDLVIVNGEENDDEEG